MEKNIFGWYLLMLWYFKPKNITIQNITKAHSYMLSIDYELLHRLQISTKVFYLKNWLWSIISVNAFSTIICNFKLVELSINSYIGHIQSFTKNVAHITGYRLQLLRFLLRYAFLGFHWQHNCFYNAEVTDSQLNLLTIYFKNK